MHYRLEFDAAAYDVLLTLGLKKERRFIFQKAPLPKVVVSKTGKTEPAMILAACKELVLNMIDKNHAKVKACLDGKIALSLFP